MTEQPPHRNDRTPSAGESATDPFGRPVGRSSDAADAFGRPVGSPSTSASAPDPVAPSHVAVSPTVGPTPPSAPTPLGVPAGFGRSTEARPAEAPAAPVQPPGSAAMALVLGIGGVLFLPIFLSVPAWIVGARARRESRALPGRPGYGMATTGWILGILGTLGWILIGLAFLGLLWLIGSSEIPYD